MTVLHEDPDVKASSTLEAQQTQGLESSRARRHVSNGLKHADDIFDIETDPKWQTTKKELWSYYLYYVGNNGLAGFNYGPSQFQNLLYLAGYDQAQPPYSTSCEGDAVCVLPFMGKVRDISSIVLITNGIAFAIQAVLFLIIGAWADYGSWRPNITIAFTILAVAVSFAWLGVMDPSKWEAGVALYMLGLISYQGALTFWTAAFPGLARSLPEMQESKRALDAGETSPAEHHTLDSLSRNRLSNISFTVCSAGEILLLAVMVGMLKGLHSDDSTENNTKAFSALIALSGGFWLLCAIPWFMFERRRPGARLPPGASLLSIGIVQTWVALRECWKLKQTFLYLMFYFLMGDVLNTCVTVIGTLQNSLASYSTLQLTYLLIVGIAAQMVGIYVFWLVQKRFKISTKKMLLFNAFWILVLCGWGLIGIWTTRFGFQHLWEIWAYQAFYGVFVCPWYAYSQTMISEVVPRGKEFLFFAMFSVIGKTSAFIGPFVSSAIIDDSGNNNMPFAFLLGLGAFSFVLLIFVNVDKSRVECAEYLAAEARLEGLEEQDIYN
ncbi:autophagy-related protein 22 [Ceratobasidium sp. AG-Ba]|nr:autophagy-related protein 22 [Ceratobasidium sp. AG-Ba]